MRWVLLKVFQHIPAVSRYELESKFVFEVIGFEAF